MKPLLVAWDFKSVIELLSPDSLRDLMSQIQGFGGEQIVISNSAESSIASVLEQLGIAAFVANVYGAGTQSKPGEGRKKVALARHKQTSGPFKRAFLIAGTQEDMRDAAGSMVTGILYDPKWLYGQKNRMPPFTDFLIENIEDALPLILKA